MPALTPGFVKNIIRGSLREIIDPSPTKTQRTQIWSYFNSECAYCGKKLNKTKKEGHIDHLVSSALDGVNHISNRVLSCATCNEKEKLDKAWEKFLKSKNPNKVIAKKRKEKIIKWREMNSPFTLDKNVLNTITSLGNKVVEFYDRKVELARQLKINSSNKLIL